MEYERRWRKVEEKFALNDVRDSCWKSPVDSRYRVYFKDQRVCKIQLNTDQSENNKRLDLEGEFELLRTLQGVRGVPNAITLVPFEIGTALVMELVEGESWVHYRDGAVANLLVFLRLVVILFDCGMRGVSHNDVRPENVIIKADGSCFLIDFDQASTTNAVFAILGNLLGLSFERNTMKHSVVKSLLKKLLPNKILDVIRYYRTGVSYSAIQKMPACPPDASENLRLVYEAWCDGKSSDANAPGQQMAYYQFEFEDFLLPGERPWDSRWRTLSTILDYRGKRVLELGCNMGLLSAHLKKESGALEVLGVDYDPLILESAKKVSKALGVSCNFRKVNFDLDTAWEEELEAFRPDVVFALNVLNWLEDKDRFLSFLGSFDTVVIEGHDDLETERSRMENKGFSSCNLIEYSERDRPVIVFEK